MGKIRRDMWNDQLVRVSNRMTWCLATQDSYVAIQKRYRTYAKGDTQWHLRFLPDLPIGYKQWNKKGFWNLNVEEYTDEQKTLIGNSHEFVKLLNPEHQIGTPFDKVI